MRKEVTARLSEFRRLPASTLRKKHEALEELLHPCGRFRSPLPIEERLQGSMAKALERFDPLLKNSAVRGPGIPLNWDLLLRYLYAVGVAGSPYFNFTPFPNDVPRVISGWIAPKLADEEEMTEANFAQGGFACAGTLEETMSKAVGELLERHFFRDRTGVRVIEASFDELRSKRRVLDINDLNAFLPEQIRANPRLKRDTSAPLRWVPAKEFATGKTTLVPTQLVFWDYPVWDEKVVLQHPTTSGCAGHFTRDEAVLGALLELIQRDGFLLYWLNTISPRVLDISELIESDADVSRLISYVERYRLKAIFVDTTSDLPVPSLTCVIVDTASQEPVISIGAGTGFDAKGMVMHALREALSVYAFAATSERFVVPTEYAPFSHAHLSRSERLSLWKGREMIDRFQFFITGKKRSLREFMGGAELLASVQERLEHVIKSLRAKGNGYEVYVYEIHSEILDRLGYHLVRTIVPQLVPLYLAEGLATLDAKRLREVPKKLGYLPTGEFNPWPHPFP